MNSGKHNVVSGQVKLQHHLTRPTATSLFSAAAFLLVVLGCLNIAGFLATAVTPVMLQQRVID